MLYSSINGLFLNPPYPLSLVTILVFAPDTVLSNESASEGIGGSTTREASGLENIRPQRYMQSHAALGQPERNAKLESNKCKILSRRLGHTQSLITWREFVGEVGGSLRCEEGGSLFAEVSLPLRSQGCHGTFGNVVVADPQYFV